MDNDELVKRLLCEVEKLPGIGMSKAPTDSLRMVLCDAIAALTTPPSGQREGMLEAPEIREIIAGHRMEPAGVSDNLAIALCTYFEGHPDCPDDEETELGWKPWAEENANRVIAEIVEAIRAAAAKLPQSHVLVPVECKHPTDCTSPTQCEGEGYCIVAGKRPLRAAQEERK
jgi:hypothetical protein